MNPLAPHNILPARSAEARRAHERNVAQPWSLLVACGMVGSVFFWGMVAVVVSGYFVPEEEKGFRQGIIVCPIWPVSTLPEEPEKVICFKPPPPPRTLRYFIPRPAKKETICFKHAKLIGQRNLQEKKCLHCDIYRSPLPPVPDVELPPLEGEDHFGIVCYGCGCEENDLLQAVLQPREPEITHCGFGADEDPRPVNLDDIQSRIRYPSPRKEGKVVLSVSINEFGHYNQHEVLTETDSRFTEAIIPHLADLRFTPKIRGGRPVLAWVTIPFRFELKY